MGRRRSPLAAKQVSPFSGVGHTDAQRGRGARARRCAHLLSGNAIDDPRRLEADRLTDELTAGGEQRQRGQQEKIAWMPRACPSSIGRRRTTNAAWRPPLRLRDPERTPTVAENIGAVAQVMANFSLADLRLVNPRDGWPQERAWAARFDAELAAERGASLSSVLETPSPT